MKNQTTGYKTHLFICTNGGTNPEKCASKGSENLRAQVKDQCKALGKEVRVNASGCLGKCEHGIAAVIYPEATWLVNLTENDNTKLVEAVETSLKR